MAEHRRRPILQALLAIAVLASLGLGTGWLLSGVAKKMLSGGAATETGGVGAGHDATKGEVAFWKSSMIPNFVSPKPGMDPMGMELIPVYKSELGQEKLITLTRATMQNMDLRTAPVERDVATQVIRTVGQIDYAEPRLYNLTLKIGGWVDNLFVSYVGQRVHKGDRLFTLYAPDLISTQEELLVMQDLPSLRPSAPMLRGDAGVNAYDKLRYWDVPVQEIEKIKRAGQIQKTVTFESPYDGWVTQKNLNVGMFMPAGSRFYQIADLSTVWVYVVLYEYQLPFVRVGQPARLTLPFRPGQVFEGKVIYIYPFVDPETRQIRVRLEFPNPQLHLKPGMYADVEISDTTGDKRLVVPRDAVMYIGERKKIEQSEQPVGFAYVMRQVGQFEPREVVLAGDVQGGRLQIASGLEEGEQVIVSGIFQLDSERKIKEANLRMLQGSSPQAKPEIPPQHHHH